MYNHPPKPGSETEENSTKGRKSGNNGETRPLALIPGADSKKYRVKRSGSMSSPGS